MHSIKLDTALMHHCVALNELELMSLPLHKDSMVQLTQKVFEQVDFNALTAIMKMMIISRQQFAIEYRVDKAFRGVLGMLTDSQVQGRHWHSIQVLSTHMAEMFVQELSLDETQKLMELSFQFIQALTKELDNIVDNKIYIKNVPKKDAQLHRLIDMILIKYFENMLQQFMPKVDQKEILSIQHYYQEQINQWIPKNRKEVVILKFFFTQRFILNRKIDQQSVCRSDRSINSTFQFLRRHFVTLKTNKKYSVVIELFEVLLIEMTKSMAGFSDKEIHKLMTDVNEIINAKVFEQMEEKHQLLVFHLAHSKIFQLLENFMHFLRRRLAQQHQNQQIQRVYSNLRKDLISWNDKLVNNSNQIIRAQALKGSELLDLYDYLLRLTCSGKLLNFQEIQEFPLEKVRKQKMFADYETSERIVQIWQGFITLKKIHETQQFLYDMKLSDMNRLLQKIIFSFRLINKQLFFRLMEITAAKLVELLENFRVKIDSSETLGETMTALHNFAVMGCLFDEQRSYCQFCRLSTRTNDLCHICGHIAARFRIIQSQADQKMNSFKKTESRLHFNSKSIWQSQVKHLRSLIGDRIKWVMRQLEQSDKYDAEDKPMGYVLLGLLLRQFEEDM